MIKRIQDSITFENHSTINSTCNPQWKWSEWTSKRSDKDSYSTCVTPPSWVAGTVKRNAILDWYNQRWPSTKRVTWPLSSSYWWPMMKRRCPPRSRRHLATVRWTDWVSATLTGSSPNSGTDWTFACVVSRSPWLCKILGGIFLYFMKIYWFVLVAICFVRARAPCVIGQGGEGGRNSNKSMISFKQR